MKVEKRELATLCVSTCVSDGGCGTGAETSTHDAQVLACEAGLLLQLTL